MVMRICSGLLAALGVMVLLASAGCDVMTSPDERLTRAERLLAEGSYNEAVVEIKNVLAKQPENARAQLALARASLQLGVAESADAALARAAAAGADAAVIADLRAQLLLQTGEYQALLTQTEAADFNLPAARRSELRARALAGLQRCVAAIEEGRSLVALNAGSAVAADVVIAECFAHLGNTGAALRMLDRTVARDPESADAQVARGRLQQLLGMNTEAESSWASAAAQARRQLSVPQQLNMLAALAQLQLKRGDTPAARATHEQMLQIAPQGVLVALLQAHIDLAEGNNEAAVSALRSLLSQHPALESLRLVLAGALLASGNPEQALQQIAALASKRPDARNLQLALGAVRALAKNGGQGEEHWLRTAAAQVILGQPGLARLSLAKAMAADQESPRAMEALARLEMSEQRYDEALRIAAMLLARNADDATALSLQSEALLAKGMYAQAQASLERLWARSPDAAVAATLARVREQGGLGKEADSLRQWLVAHPDDVQSRGLLADLLRRQGKSRESIVEFERLAAAVPDSIPVLNNLAWLYYLERDVRALALAERAWKGAPQNASVGDTYGWLLVEGGQLAEGLKVLTTAWQAGGIANADTRYHFATALARSGDTERARQVLTDLIKEEPAFPALAPAKELLEQLKK
jgi:Tfp pilus assembly protein PilF